MRLSTCVKEDELLKAIAQVREGQLSGAAMTRMAGGSAPSLKGKMNKPVKNQADLPKTKAIRRSG